MSLDLLSYSAARAAAKKSQSRRRAASVMGGLVPVATRQLPSYAPATSQAGSFSAGTTGQSEMHRQDLIVTADVNGIVLVFGNHGYDILGPNDITVRASLEWTVPSSNGGLAAERCYFNGAESVVIKPGALVKSDPIPCNIPKGATFYVRTYVTGIGGAADKWPFGRGGQRLLGTPTPDLTGSAGALAGSSSATAYGPAAVLGYVPDSQDICIGILGDSIMQGVGDSGGSNQANGWAERGLNANYGFVNISRHSEKATDLVTASNVVRRVRYAFANGCTHVLFGHGVNDVAAWANLGSVQARIIPAWKMLGDRGIPLYQVTLPPRTTSSDSWATVGNQTALATEAVRTGFNDWIRDGAPILAGAAAATGSSAPGTLRAGDAGHPLVGYIETADAVESARNSGKWKASNSGDGVHPNATGHAAMGAVLTTFAAAHFAS